MNEASQLQDLLGFGRVVAGIEGATDNEKADVAAHLGMTLKEKTERAQKHIDPFDLLDPPDEQDEPLALIASELLACVGLSDRMEEHRSEPAWADGNAWGVGARKSR